jgi:plastocyanin
MHTARWAASGAAVLAMLSVAACGGGGGTPARHVTFNLTIDGHTMRPDSPTAHQGDTVTVNINADRKEEIHLHGYDYKFEMTPGQRESRTFTADKTGSFEIEIEGTSTHLGELDVYPR